MFTGIKILGTEKIPGKGSLLIASNHISFWDPFLIGLCLPREVYFLAKIELFKENKLFAWLIRTYNAVPLKKEAGGISAMKKARELLQKKRAVCIFPEGTRSKTGEILPIKKGIGLLSVKTKAPIVPSYIYGAREGLKKWILRKAPLIVSFGDPIYPEKKTKEEIERITQELEKALHLMKNLIEKNQNPKPLI